MIVKTATGSTYEFAADRVRRVKPAHSLRRDEEWLRFGFATEPTVGEAMVLLLEPLGEGNVTVRTTSPVMEVLQ